MLNKENEESSILELQRGICEIVYMTALSKL
jgi:hypothetical protein